MNEQELIQRCNQLRGSWLKRGDKMKVWYNQLRLQDDLKQDGMESVVGNDPRTGYNLGRHLLVTSIIAHKIDIEGLEPEQVAAIADVERYIPRRWAEHERRFRSKGRQGFLWSVVSWLMGVGWYSIFSMVDEDRIWSEVWSPAETFPEFGEDGIVEVAHIYPQTQAQAQAKAIARGWKIDIPAGIVWVYDWWKMLPNGTIGNAVVLGNKFAIPPTEVQQLTKVKRLPVFTMPVGGLPDMGSIDANWQEHWGESLVATNEQLTINYNKMLTYIQQIARDAANPRWLELSSSETPIAREADMFKRGVIFRGQPGDSLNPIASPPIPIEIQGSMVTYQNMAQRGLFPYGVFGNLQSQMSYLAMANVAASSLQLLTPYSIALAGLISDLDNYWLNMMEQNGYAPYSWKRPNNLPKSVEFDAEVDIEIPGYLVQRATVARMLDPQFRLPTTHVMSRLFPEVKDPLKAQAESRRDSVMNNPRAVLADGIIEYKKQADRYREAGDTVAADVFDKLAQALESEMTGVPPGQGQQPKARVSPEAGMDVGQTLQQLGEGEAGTELNNAALGGG